ncbi:hypothetical protein VOLCADRAFT_98389 [Volvox carteri f. nagariensis]|uniref:Uncharacterized protein n=1 Tax=Volvox carteri f. nagariensis TaxID=3068 RepID=D8UF80_VOLCA|nr:uncharacterized protein VOLCADRAFT_98389 [Volvox carteri f. nagariensis]EFJ41635.1 hypothetical protein VOLCADRAFT_98389 [Volvox carteri f. nagariensis]|eukprot:XP_002957291.1 hypothetical protein VOLCADRAFT_98389 [Volvox carteri f. nagariensis]
MCLLGFRCIVPVANSAFRPKRQTRRAQLNVLAATSTSGTDAGSTSTSGAMNSAYVRILRYPDGNERRIIYPTPPAPEVEIDIEESWSLWTQEDPDPLVEELAMLQSRHPRNVSELVGSSYQVLTGSPWLLPRPLFVLTQRQLATGQATLYCLQTRTQEEEVQDELARVLKRPSLASSLTFSRLRDGVVAFDRAEDAARYATCLEADIGLEEVDVMEVDSRQLFRLTGEVDAVVVYLPWSDFMPLPHQLAQALRE